jgi:hypothetical protein
MTKPRDYAHEYASYHAKPEQKKNRAQRNAARADMVAAGKVHRGDGKDVDHKNPIRSGGSNSKGNLAVASQAKNRSWRAGKKD